MSIAPSGKPVATRKGDLGHILIDDQDRVVLDGRGKPLTFGTRAEAIAVIDQAYLTGWPPTTHTQDQR